MNKELTECEATAAPEGYEYVWDRFVTSQWHVHVAHLLYLKHIMF